MAAAAVTDGLTIMETLSEKALNPTSEIIVAGVAQRVKGQATEKAMEEATPLVMAI